MGHSFSSREQASFNFMASVSICSDFGAQTNKSLTLYHPTLGYLCRWPLTLHPECFDSTHSFQVTALMSDLHFLMSGLVFTASYPSPCLQPCDCPSLSTPQPEHPSEARHLSSSLSTPQVRFCQGFPWQIQAPECIHWVGDTIQPFCPLLSPCHPAFNLSQHQDLFWWVNSSHQVAKVLEFKLQHQSFQWLFRTDFL